jgi:RHS repeat-associated protein
VLAETGADNSPKYYYIYGLGLAYLIDAHTEEPLFYHYDPISSTVALTSYSGGVVGKYSYDEFGKLNTCSCVTGNPYQYVGKFGVAAAPEGLLYMRARYYDTSTGRFLTRDPVTGSFDKPISLHDYLYASANPLMNIDPAGTVEMPSPPNFSWEMGGYIDYAGSRNFTSGSVSIISFAFPKPPPPSDQTEAMLRYIGGLIASMGMSPFAGPVIQAQANEVYTDVKVVAEIKKDVAPCGLWGAANAQCRAQGNNPAVKEYLSRSGMLIEQQENRETQTNLWQQLVNNMNAFQNWFQQTGETGANTSEPQDQSVQGTQGPFTHQSKYHPGTLTAANLSRKPAHKPIILERYEPKFRIINKTNAKDLR